MKSLFLHQLGLLLWKNFRLRKRKPFSLICEMLIPLFIVVILVAVRNAQLRFKIGRCEFKEKQMASMGPIPFLRDFLCTFNITCYSKTQIDWSGNYSNDFPTFISNITNVYNSFPKGSATTADIIIWAGTHPNEIEQLRYSLIYISNTTAPLLLALGQIQSGNDTLISQLICGSNESDLTYFMRIVGTGSSRKKRSLETCRIMYERNFLKSSVSYQIYQLTAPLIFGKIYYTPDTPFTQEIMKRSNVTFKILDDLRLSAVEWRLNFRDWFLNYMNNNSQINNLRTVCKSQSSSFCQIVNTDLNPSKIQAFADALSVVFGVIEKALNCTELNKFVPMQSSVDIDNLSNQSMINIYAGLVLNDTFKYLTAANATFLSYQIRMPTNRIDSTKKFKVLDTFWTPTPRISSTSDFKYYTSGFLLLQEALDQAFIELVTDNISTNVGSSMQIMPYPCFINDKFIRFMANMMPFLLIIAWLPTVTILIKNIVYEKENRLKEFMRVMGLSNLVHWVGWFISILTVLMLPIIIMTIMLKYSEIITFSSAMVIFLILFFYVISFICQCFMISVFFDKANVASVAGGIIYFVFYLPFLLFINLQDDLTVEMYYGGGLLTQVAFCNALNFVAYWEQSTDGAQFSNFFESSIIDLNFGIGHCIVMMWIDSVIYLIIAWYVEAVFPGEFGIPKPWYFLFTKSYWCPDDINCSSNEVTPFPSPRYLIPDSKTNEQGFENEPVHLQVGISIRNLVKHYSKAKTPAVNDLNLNFYQSQITAFLGHNGAGKTTTISVLTGIFAPTSGTAYILNDDIRTNMDKIRKKMGLCPQHNILFGDLTVEDHIYFYGRLKGMDDKLIREGLPKIVEDVGLTKKINTASKKLSGGMKRKLSVAMAFIGDSRIVFLDEPTAGVDPFARRGIWDLLIKYRNDDRTIILTTHHMDEADYLSDRIAIISQGKLQCCGSSVFLKKLFGDGYYLILVKSDSVQGECFTNGISTSGEKVLNFVRSFITDAKMTEETRTQWSIVLPQTETNSAKFSNLFEELDQSMNRLNVVTYGLSDTSLEEVFLKVAEDPSGVVDDIKERKINFDVLNTLTDGGNLPRPASVLSLRNKSEFSQIDELPSIPFQSTGTHELVTGRALLSQQLLGLQIKRFHYTKRNIKGFITELILPICIILLMIGLLTISSSFANQPSMVISPWLMMPKTRLVNLNTFYRKENISNPLIDKLVDGYRSDLGESGVRCMESSIYQLSNYKCYPENKVNRWSAIPSVEISLRTPDCDCNKTGYQVCSDLASGGPQFSSRLMTSSDIVGNLTGYNISDHLMKKFKTYIKKQYGGYQFLLPSNFGQSCKMIGELPLWNGMNQLANSSQKNSRENPQKFLFYFQEFFNMSGIKTNFTRIWINSKGYVSMTAYANIFSNLLLRTRMNFSEKANHYGITVANFPFKYTQKDLLSQLYTQMFLEVSLAVFVIFGLSFIPASFVIFLIEERVTGAKRQQFVSGVNPYVYWISNFLWDIVKYIIPVFIVILIFQAFNYQSYIGSLNVGAFIIILIFYGLAIIPHMYPFSFFLSTPSTAFVILNAYNLLVGAVSTVATFFLDLLQDDDKTLKPVNDALKKVFLIFPQYDLGRGMMDLSFNYLRYNVTDGKSTYDPFDWNTTGEKLCSLSVLCVFWWIVLCIMESGIINRALCGKLKNIKLKHNEIKMDEDNDVCTERRKIVSDEDVDDVLKVINLTKIYNPSLNTKNRCCRKALKESLSSEKRKLAINNICFGVKEGECFGLLGVNGAGKTTTFKMLTGEEDITHGNAFINKYSIIDDMINAHKNMGFCPQFDALHSLLTCEEQLYFYCRIRGIEKSQIASTVELSLKNLSLIPHTKKQTQTLSGGNKRKLSTAIALIGFPKVIFLDEPTSGMDAGARRFLWNIIQKITEENKIAVILTSHNMEECEVLCHRLSIMVNGELKCIGSVQHLKSKFGDDYYVKIRLQSDRSHSDNREKIKDIMDKEFGENVSLKDENFVTLQYRFSSSAKLSMIFEFFENLKRVNYILDYSVSQTSLDDVFINFAKEEDISETKNRINLLRNGSVEGHVNPSFDGTSTSSM